MKFDHISMRVWLCITCIWWEKVKGAFVQTGEINMLLLLFLKLCLLSYNAAFVFTANNISEAQVKYLSQIFNFFPARQRAPPTGDEHGELERWVEGINVTEFVLKAGFSCKQLISYCSFAGELWAVLKIIDCILLPKLVKIVLKWEKCAPICKLCETSCCMFKDYDC